MRGTDHRETARLLARRGLGDVEPTPLLAARLAVRRRARLGDSVLLAAFLIGAALTHVVGRLTDGASSRLPLLVLTADVVLRVEDARALVTPSLEWSLPAIFLYGESLGWWNAVSLALVVAGALALSLVQTRSAGVGVAARQALATR